MKVKVSVSITYDREIDSEWYENCNSKEKAISEFGKQVDSADGFDVVLNDIETLNYKVSVKEIV
jgi:hypothetical protein